MTVTTAPFCITFSNVLFEYFEASAPERPSYAAYREVVLCSERSGKPRYFPQPGMAVVHRSSPRSVATHFLGSSLYVSSGTINDMISFLGMLGYDVDKLALMHQQQPSTETMESPTAQPKKKRGSDCGSEEVSLISRRERLVGKQNSSSFLTSVRSFINFEENREEL